MDQAIQCATCFKTKTEGEIQAVTQGESLAPGEARELQHPCEEELREPPPTFLRQGHAPVLLSGARGWREMSQQQQQQQPLEIICRTLDKDIDQVHLL